MSDVQLEEKRGNQIPRAFIFRRLHSLTGFFLVLFLFEHLLVNSQAALFIGDDGKGFIDAVNSIKSLPYLPVLEAILLGLPFLLHGALGISYLFSMKPNSYGKDPRTPHLKSGENSRYTWQRITAVILVAGVLLHVVSMRFFKRPDEVKIGPRVEYIARVGMDDGLYTLAPRLGVQVLDQMDVVRKKQELQSDVRKFSHLSLKKRENKELFDEEEALFRGVSQELKERKKEIESYENKPLSEGDVFVVTSKFGTSFLLIIRDTFKSFWMCVLYSAFVMAATFHGASGLWTFLLSWGVVQSEKSQRQARIFSNYFMFLILFLGLSSIWGTYWLNLKV